MPVVDTRAIVRAEGPLAESILRARHALRALHDPASALVVVHGPCPAATCASLNLVEVHADTRMLTCSSCGRRYLV